MLRVLVPILYIFAFLHVSPIFAQSKKAQQKEAGRSLEALSWLAESWQGEENGTTTEEVWSAWSAQPDDLRALDGEWKDGVLEYDIEVVRVSDDSRLSLIRREFRITPNGLLARVVVGEPAQLDSVALYRHPKDIALPNPAKAAIADMAWLAGPWVGKRGKSSMEERWSPPLGGAILGVSRTVSRGKMVAFEYLRIVELDGGLVYVAQPGGRPPTEFVLTELDTTRAVFENPRHDFPQRIVYELSDEGALSASIGFAKGGRPKSFEFTREGK